MMRWFRRKQDPISERARDLNRQIQELEQQIKQMADQSATAEPMQASPAPAVRPNETYVPSSNLIPRFGGGGGTPHAGGTGAGGGGGSVSVPGQTSGTQAQAQPQPQRRESEFEKVSQQRLTDLQQAQPHFNELGVRKFDLPGAWRKFLSQFHGPTPASPKLVDLLAAGSIQGMRPLRYEKRIARRRFLVFVVILFIVLWGIFAVFIPH